MKGLAEPSDFRAPSSVPRRKIIIKREPRGHSEEPSLSATAALATEPQPHGSPDPVNDSIGHGVADDADARTTPSHGRLPLRTDARTSSGGDALGATATANDATKNIAGQRKSQPGDHEEERSEADAHVQSPSTSALTELDDENEIVVRTGAKRGFHSRSALDTDDEGNTTMTDDEPAISQHPKRRRINGHAETPEPVTMVVPAEMAVTRSAARQNAKADQPRPSWSGRVETMVGQWRNDKDLDTAHRHAVVAMVDAQKRLRFRIEHSNVDGDPLGLDNPRPEGPGRYAAKMHRVIFFDHLVGLSKLELKEYVRLRADPQGNLDEAQARIAADTEAARQAILYVRDHASADNWTNDWFEIAQGEERLQESSAAWLSFAARRRQLTEVAAAMANADADADAGPPEAEEQPSRAASVAPSRPRRFLDNELHGTRPTHIVLGYWKGSQETDVEGKHAVDGILRRDNKLRLRATKRTRDGRLVKSKFPFPQGVSWIQLKDVVLEPHLRGGPWKDLRRVLKEYCRVRQYQIDHGETDVERAANEAEAIEEARVRVLGPDWRAAPSRGASDDTDVDAEPSSKRKSTSQTGPARKESLVQEAAQECADRSALQREESNAATDAGRPPTALHSPEEVQRPNNAWASQEPTKIKGGAEGAMVHDGIQYERKATGPFVGKLVSRGNLITIDGEDYVEYRVLTKPSF